MRSPLIPQEIDGRWSQRDAVAHVMALRTPFFFVRETTGARQGRRERETIWFALDPCTGSQDNHSPQTHEHFVRRRLDVLDEPQPRAAVFGDQSRQAAARSGCGRGDHGALGSTNRPRARRRRLLGTRTRGSTQPVSPPRGRSIETSDRGPLHGRRPHRDGSQVGRALRLTRSKTTSVSIVLGWAKGGH